MAKHISLFFGMQQTLDDFVKQRGLPSIYTQPGQSPYPALGASILTAAQSTLKPYGFRNFGLFGISTMYAVSAYSLIVDVENGSSMATAWSVVYLSMFGKNAVRGIIPGITTAAVTGNLFVYLTEMLD